MKKKIFTFLLVCAYSSIFLLAQNDFKPGYVINLNNDTVKGKINYTGDSEMSIACHFMDSSGNINVYNPIQIKAYLYDNSRFFKSATVEINNEKQLVFLEYLVKAKVSVLSFTDSYEQHFFLEKDGLIKEIKSIEYSVYDPEKGRVTGKSEGYKAILKYYYADCPAMVSKIENFNSINKSSLIKLNDEYLQQTNQNSTLVYKKEKTKREFNYGIGLIYGFNNYSFEDSWWEIYINKPTTFYVTYTAKTQYMMGVQASGQMNIPEISDRFYINLNVVAGQKKISGSLDTLITMYLDTNHFEKTRIKNDFGFQNMFFKTSLFVSYKFKYLEGYPYFLAGASYITNINYSYTGVNARKIPETNKSFYSWMFGAGVETYVYKDSKIAIQIIYEQYSPLKDEFNIKESGVNVSVSYIF